MTTDKIVDELCRAVAEKQFYNLHPNDARKLLEHIEELEEHAAGRYAHDV